MKTILVGINAKYIHSSLAIRSIKASCKDIEIAEYTINENLRSIFANLYEKKADVYGFSMYIWNREEVLEVASLLKKANPETIIFFGGPEAWGNDQGLMKEYPMIDFIVLGEGEKTVPLCLEHIEKGESFSEIPGVSYRESGRILENKVLEPLDFNALPFPYDENSLIELKDRIIYYESSRGCPFGCSYCMSSLDKSVRFRDLEKVKEELLFFINHNVPIVKFVDRTFNCDAKRTEELFRFLIENQKETLFHFEISADLLTPGILKLLKGAPKGLFQFEIGIQSTSKETLLRVNRKNNLEQSFENIKALVEMGNIHIHTDLIAGLPGESLETFKKSFNETYALRAPMLQLGFLKVLFGSPILREAAQYGLVFSDKAPYEIIKTDAMSAGDLIELKEVEKALEAYHNSGRFSCSLDVAAEAFKTPYDLFLSLGKKMGRYNRSHSALVDILWDTSKKEELLLPLGIDFLLENKGKPLPSYIPGKNPADWKMKVKTFMEEKYGDGYKEAVKHTRIENLCDRIILFDYKDKTFEDITQTFRKVTE